MILLKDGKSFVERVLVQVGVFACPLCNFTRTFSTKAGALEGVDKHMRAQHGIRMMLPRTHSDGYRLPEDILQKVRAATAAENAERDDR